MRKTDFIILMLLAVSSVLFLVNFELTQAPVVGTIATVLFVGSASIVLGKLLFTRESMFFRVVFGVATLLALLALTGTIFTLVGQFTATLSLLTLITISASLGVASVLIGRKKSQGISDLIIPKKAQGKGSIESYIFILPFALSVIVAFRLLLLAQTGEGETSVWLAIPDLFVAAYLISALFLSIILLFTKFSAIIKLGLICVFSFLSHSLFLLVWYPGRYGDPWSHMGEIRYIVRTGMPYAYSWMLQNSYWADLVTYRAYHALVTFFVRMFYVDVYWIHILFIPILWSVLTPLLAYKVAETFTIKKLGAFPLLAALTTVLFPFLVSWGAVSVANSLGFILFFVTVTLLVVWMRHGGRALWFVALLAATVSLLAHPQSGFFSFMFVFFTTVIQKTSRKLLWVASFLLILVIYPIALYFGKASFAGVGLFQVANIISFQSEISTLPLILALIGLVLGIRGRYVASKTLLLFFVFYVLILGEYYFTKYGMSNLPFGSARILVMSDFLLVPLFALGLLTLVAPLKKFYSGSKNNVSSKLSSLELNPKLTPRILGLILISLFLSLQAVTALYQAYPENEVQKVQPSVYELEAIRFIDSNSSGRYVVVCEPSFASLAIGSLGIDYGYLGAGTTRGIFGYPDWSYPTVQMYNEMTKTPSVGILQQALNFARATVAYFVVSVRNPNFDGVVERTLEILPAWQVFGDGKLYVFAYPLQVHEEQGSMVKVVFEDGLGGEQNVQTEFTYMVESEINSTLTLSGYTRYNVTEFPPHWTFLEMRVNNETRPFDDSSDINTFVYMKGLLPSDVLTIKWHFNRRYPKVGWKEDSFKRLDKWRTHDLYSGTIIPAITSDGNTLRLSYSFKAGSYQYYYYVTNVGLATNDYPYLLMRWRCDQTVAIAAVYFDSGGAQETVALGSMSPEWSSIVVPLEPDRVIITVMVGLNNLNNEGLNAQATLEIDYIMLSAKP